jgi:ribose-phosphate pyrophosphokinase
VANEHVIVCQSLSDDGQYSTNDRLVRLLFFIGAVKDALAAKVTVVAPYLTYARKDRRTKPGDPVSTRYVAQMFESVGLDCIVTVDVHNLAAFENAFRCRKVHIEALPVLVDHSLGLITGAARTVVVAPDVGGSKRARAFADALAARSGQPIETAFIEKHRSEGVVSGDLFAGDVSAATALILDDMICGGTTIARAAIACHTRGASSVHLIATHGLFGHGASDKLATLNVDSIVVTDTVPDTASRCPAIAGKLTVLDTAHLIADTLKRLAVP